MSHRDLTGDRHKARPTPTCFRWTASERGGQWDWQKEMKVGHIMRLSKAKQPNEDFAMINFRKVGPPQTNKKHNLLVLI